MPTFPVRRTTYLLRRHLKHFMWMAGVAALATTCLITFVLWSFPTIAAGVLCTGLAIFVGRYTYFVLRGRQSRSQLQLEARFMRQPLNKEPLSACIRGDNQHLWSGSHTCKALRRALALPLPRLMLFEEKLERLYRFFRLAYRPLEVRMLRMHLYTLAATSLVVIVFLAMSPSPELMQLGGGLLTAVAFIESALWHKRMQIRRQMNSYLRGLSRWTLSERQRGTLRDDIHKPYQHDLLYDAPRWFPASGGGDVEHAA